MSRHSLYRFAAVDIGSNAVRLLLCNVVRENNKTHFNKSELVRVPLRLGEDVFRYRRISNSKCLQFVKVMRAFKALTEVFDPIAYRACATAALREAINGQELVSRVKNDSGLEIQIISGKEEAEIIYSNHVEERLDHDGNYLYIDVGGGSTEITLFSKGECVNSRSFNIGTLRMLHGGVSKGLWEEMKDWVRAVSVPYDFESAIGSGGNINKINKLIGKKDRALPFSYLRDFYDELKVMSVDERIDTWELNPDRADVIVPAAKIFLSIMKAANVDQVLVPEIGLADGIIHRLFDAHVLRRKTA